MCCCSNIISIHWQNSTIDYFFNYYGIPVFSKPVNQTKSTKLNRLVYLILNNNLHRIFITFIIMLTGRSKFNLFFMYAFLLLFFVSDPLVWFPFNALHILLKRNSFLPFNFLDFYFPLFQSTHFTLVVCCCSNKRSSCVHFSKLLELLFPAAQN